MVPGGGHLDGAFGLLAGLECLRCMKERNPQLRLPIEAVAFTDAEARFGGMLGTPAFRGRLTLESIHATTDLFGITLEAAMQERGLHASLIPRAKRPRARMEAAVELHY